MTTPCFTIGIGLFRLLPAVLVAVLAMGCQTAPRTTADRQSLEERAELTVAAFQEEDPTIGRFFDDSAGYAVFPSIARGGAGVGGAYGRGVLYEDGRMAGVCDVSQGTVGFQLGGQSFSQVIFFETVDALESFKSGNFAFTAQATAVAAKHGASADADYERGVAVFTMTRGGLMYEAAIGGQKFSYEAR